MLNERYVDALNSKWRFIRLASLKKIAKSQSAEDLNRTKNVALQIHTSYSFSPYYPAMAAFMANKFQLSVAGVMDNYTVSGAKEFIKACKILKLTYSIGVEIRANFDFENISTSNIAVMGIAKKYFKQFELTIKDYRDNQINNIMASIEGVNKRIKKLDLSIDFKKDVQKYIKALKNRVYLSKYVYLALAEKLATKYTKGQMLEVLQGIGVKVNDSEKTLLTVEQNPYYVYDLANVLFDSRNSFYCKKNYAKASDITKFAHANGAICSFEYFIKEKMVYSKENSSYNTKLLEYLKGIGFDGVCFDYTKFDDKLLDEFIAKMREMEMLPFNYAKVEFPREDFALMCDNQVINDLMLESAYTVVGSEMCENLTGEGYISSNLKTNGYKDKITLFSKIGRGE